MENTPNIGLKRWEGGDRILHSEFNDNWDKIDAGLGQALLEKRAIKTVTLTDPQSVNDIPVDDINWAEWSVVGMEVPFYPDSGDDTQYVCAPNLGALTYTSGHRTGLMHSTINPFALLLLPMRDPERNVSSLALIKDGGYGYAHNIPFKNLTSLRLIYNSNTKRFPKGQKIYFWGIR